MTSARECKDRFEAIVALVMGELEPAAAQELQDHLAVCAECREVRDALIEEEKDLQASFAAFARNLGALEQPVLDIQSHKGPSRIRVGLYHNHFLERAKNMILSHKRLSMTAAAVAILAACSMLYVSTFSLSSAAYALEETLQANKGVTSYHFKTTPAPKDSLGEAWIELNPDGTLLRARLDIFSPDDGPKVSIVTTDRAEVWFKMKHGHVILGENDKEMIQKVRKEIEQSRAAFDPKLAFEQLEAEKKAGKVQVTTREPDKEGGPIQFTVTSKDKFDERRVFDVDPESKLVVQMFEWRRHGDRWQVERFNEYLDYNKEFDPQVFQLKLPKYVTTVNRITTTIGLEQGNLTEDEIATKVAKDFFEALIAGDYQKASHLYEGIPAEQLKKAFDREEIKLLRIVEIGKAVRGKHPDKHALQVPVKVEAEVRGKKIIQEMSPFIREESGRWTICGGI